VEKAMVEFGAPYVIKDDGLAAGKGVVVTSEKDVAIAHATECFANQDAKVVVEEFLDGPEVSLFLLCDGKSVLPLQPAQDFKRVGDNDAGPNTGGMGAYSPLPWAQADLSEFVVTNIGQPVIDYMQKIGKPFSGVLFVGLAITSKGPKVIEFNARFGDPETQVVLARLKTPLASVLYFAATGKLNQLPPLEWSQDAAVTVVVASENYPKTPVLGDVIAGLDRAAALPNIQVLHAGTAERAGEIITAGGRVLSVTATGPDLKTARARAYEAVGQIRIHGAHFRTDIAQKAAN
jgi:phosphoribosylamine--glycine ligase